MPYNSALSEKLQTAALINPTVYDIIRKICTRWSDGTRLVMSAMQIKSIAMETADEKLNQHRTRLEKARSVMV